MKHIKEVWAALKPLKITPNDYTFGPEESQLVEDRLSGSRPVHEKQLQGFQALWALLNRCCPSMAPSLSAVCKPMPEALPLFKPQAGIHDIQQRPLLIARFVG